MKHNTAEHDKMRMPIQGFSFTQVTLEIHFRVTAVISWDSQGLALEQAPASALVPGLALALVVA